MKYFNQSVQICLLNYVTKFKFYFDFQKNSGHKLEGTYDNHIIKFTNNSSIWSLTPSLNIHSSSIGHNLVKVIKTTTVQCSIQGVSFNTTFHQRLTSVRLSMSHEKLRLTFLAISPSLFLILDRILDDVMNCNCSEL